MLGTRNIFFFAVSALSLVRVTDCLQESFIDSGIVITEEIIRNTTNKLFSSLKLKRDSQKLNQYITINKYFASITIQEHDNLKKISRLSRANTENNGSTIFMTAINELLNEDNHNIEENEIKHDVITENHDDHIVDIIETFLTRLRHARELYDVSSYVKINEKVLNIIIEARTANTSDETKQDDHMAINTTSEEIDLWKPSGRRIYTGQRTKIKHFPFMASIQMFNNFQCAGSIIKSDLVITASSCLQLAWNNRFFRENPAFLAVRVGSSFYSGGGEVISVLEVYFHPTYDPKTLKNNICIVRLTRKIKFSWRARRRVRKIDIDRHASKLPYNTPGITILGWGAKGRSNIVGDPWKNILSYAVLDIYPLRECQEIYSKEYVTHKNFCAGFMSKGGGACNRDIGGPGIDDGTLVGVVSFGSPVCGAVDAPTVFTKLGYYFDWIEDIMHQKVPSSRKVTTLKPKMPPSVFHTTLGTTTYKIPPLPSKMKPIGINEFENVLRMVDDDLFEEFMRTMFDSKEMAEYQDAFKDVKQDMANKILVDGKTEAENEEQILKYKQQILQDKKMLVHKDHNLTTAYTDLESDTATKIMDFEAESIETVTDSSQYTVLSDDSGLKPDKVDNQIEELIKNIDLKKIIEEETDAAKKIEVDAAKKIEVDVPKKIEVDAATEPIFIDDIGFQPGGSKNESVLTLLYLSEENKDKDKEVEESREDGNGLSIVADSFHDMTRSKGKTIGTHNDLPEKELYEILSEVIDDEVRNDETRI